MLNKSNAWALAALTALALSTNVARADVATATTPSVSVVYSQKDLTSTQGVQTLYARLKSAARDVCPAVDVRDLKNAVPAKRCYESALTRAVEAVRRPELTALHVHVGHHSAG